jgi:hypothetical protein
MRNGKPATVVRGEKNLILFLVYRSTFCNKRAVDNPNP